MLYAWLGRVMTSSNWHEATTLRLARKTIQLLCASAARRAHRGSRRATSGALIQMEDSPAIPDRSGWDAVQVRDAGRGMAALRKKRRGWIDTAILVGGAIIAHGAIGYFGWQWIESNKPMRAPTPAIAPAATTIAPVDTTPSPPPHVPTNDSYAGTMRWKKNEGLTITPDKAADWKCVGGFYFTMTKDANGTTVIEGVMSNRRPVRC